MQCGGARCYRHEHQADSKKLKKGFHVGIPDSDLFYRKLENFRGAVFKPDFFYLLDTKSLFTTRSPTWVAFVAWFLRKIVLATSSSVPITIHISERIAAAWRC
jgi:hypothetical protein